MAKAEKVDKSLKRFRVLHNKHTEPAGEEGGGEQVYGKSLENGDVVETTRDLVKMFGASKFERLSDKAPAEVVAREKQKEKKSAKAGDDDATPHGAQQDPTVAGALDPAGLPLDKDNVHDNVTPKGEGGLASQVSKLGENVTDEFPKATEAELIVLKHGRHYHVAEKDDPDSPVNKKPLSKGQVGAFLSKQLKG